MTDSGSYDKHASHRDADAEIERLAAQARHGWDKEAGLLSAEELERFRESHAAFRSAPRPFAFWLSVLVCGEKP